MQSLPLKSRRLPAEVRKESREQAGGRNKTLHTGSLLGAPRSPQRKNKYNQKQSTKTPSNPCLGSLFSRVVELGTLQPSSSSCTSPRQLCSCQDLPNSLRDVWFHFMGPLLALKSGNHSPEITMGNVQVVPQHRVTLQGGCLMVLKIWRKPPKEPSCSLQSHRASLGCCAHPKEPQRGFHFLCICNRWPPDRQERLKWQGMMWCWWHHLWLPLSTHHNPQISSELQPSARTSQMNPQLTAGVGKELYRKSGL